MFIELFAEDFDDHVKTLYPHQVDGLAFLLARKRSILADDMGLGKTRQAILALSHGNPTQPFLVVCPASLKINWEREIHMIFPEDKVKIISTGIEIDPNDRWVIINYDILGKFSGKITSQAWSGLVFDEAHYLKNHTSKRSKECRGILESVDHENLRVLCLTGTPLTNRPRDLFPLLQLVGHPMGKSFLSFAKRYCAAYKNDFGWVTDGASNLSELATQLQGCMIRRTKDEVLDLPPKIRTWMPVEVASSIGKIETRKLLNSMLEGRNSEGGRRLALGKVHDQADQADRTAILGLLTKLRNKLAIAKVDESIDFIENCIEQGHKVVVFSCFDDPVQKIYKKFEDQAVQLTGSTPAKDRQEIVDEFQNNPNVMVFVSNLIAGGVGINLTAASQVLFNDLDWVPANHWQAEDRAYRIGQKSLVNVHYLVASETIDEFVQAVLEIKSDLFQAVVSGNGLEGEYQKSILEELESALSQMSISLADKSFKDIEDGDLSTMMEKLALRIREQLPTANAQTKSEKEKPTLSEAMNLALANLAKALAGPKSQKYKVGSSSSPGKFYELEADNSGDVYCSCPGFSYRGMCSHARTLKDSMAKNNVPKGYEPVS